MALLVRLRLLDGTIRELGVDQSAFADPDELRIDQVFDATAWFAIPGLADAHAHLAAGSVDDMVRGPASPRLDLLRSHARRQLAAGILLLADKGATSDASLAILADPPADRPELHMAGAMISVPGGYYPGFGRQIAPEETVAAVEVACTTPASWVKLVGDWPRRGVGPQINFDEATLRAAVETAHAAGRRVAVHTMAPETPGLAVRAGVDSIEHGLFLTDDDIVVLGSRGGAWVPTIAAMEAVRDSLGPASSGWRLLSEGLGRVASLLPGAAAAGVVVLAGTDLALPHGAVAQEAERLVAYGLKPEAALHALTGAAYEYFGSPTGFRPGAPADFVCVAADPRDEISALQEPSVVMRWGRFVLRPG